MARVLIVDDDQGVCEILATVMEVLGHQPSYALTLNKGLQALQQDPFDVVFLDVRLPDGNGLTAIPGIKELPSSPEVIIITGEETPEGAQVAMESGAWDYLPKPLTTSEVGLATSRALEYREGKKASTTPLVLERDEIAGNSPAMRRCLEQVAKAAPSTANVLITGETGTGKELFARCVHHNSTRSGGPFVVVDCAALTEPLVESALFGHVKGSFTGANRDRDGLVKEAHLGTLFLDEVGELPMTMQGAFLRVLQERRFRPVGGDREISSDFRLIAATNRDLAGMVERGLFRNDLLFRLKSIVIQIPPLRERPQDITDIALSFIFRFCRDHQRDIKGVSPEFLEALLQHTWPGNVRELIHTLESSLSSSGEEPILYPIHLPLDLRSQLARKAITSGKSDKESGRVAPRQDVSAPLPLRDVLASVEKRYLQDLIAHTDGNIQEACKISGVSRANLYARLKRHGIARHY